MDRPQIPLNALRAFESAARHLHLGRAAVELCVTQAAVSHQIKGLEERLGVSLFRRVPRGLVLTDEGAALVPVLTSAFDKMAETLDRFMDGRFHETLHVGVVGTFAVGWLMPRLAEFEALHPTIDLRIYTNNNRVDLAGEGLDMAIRFGDGNWQATEAVPLFAAPMTPLCSPGIAREITMPSDLAQQVLLRSYRADEWLQWFSAAETEPPPMRAPMCDSSVAIAQMAVNGYGVALLPTRLFEREIAEGSLCRLFDIEVAAGSYWLTRLSSRGESPAMINFRTWLVECSRATSA
ncbi:LysR family transcriptional regulator [Tabrizicola sp.]|uniref:LysR family transcriptional regulator n=1 Tax=Tabrizicola sp. TaxID=2005166 RepID=UPI003F3CA4D5